MAFAPVADEENAPVVGWVDPVVGDENAPVVGWVAPVADEEVFEVRSGGWLMRALGLLEAEVFEDR